jgi:hypothetical protein
MTSGHSYLRVSQRFESMYILQGENQTNTLYAWPLGSNVRQMFAKSLLSQNWAPAPRMKSWPPVIVRPDRHPRLPHSSSNKPPRSREGRFDKIVTWPLGLLGPINLTCGQYKSKLVHRGQNGAFLNRHMQWLPPWNLRITMALSPPFPFK